MTSSHRYFLLNKPHGMESQFVSSYPNDLLGSLNFNFPKGIHAIGRLDKDSEGLLLLTTNKKITRLLFQGPVPHKRTYLVQVKNTLSEEGLFRLRTGVSIRIRGGSYYTTPPCKVDIVEKPTTLFPSTFPAYNYGSSTWLTISLTEGKFHQVRKMTFAVGHRVLRLIRISIEELHLGDLAPGEILEVTEAFFFSKLNLYAPQGNDASTYDG
jgi:23S rRNA pseudouridine2457 synthase